MAKSRISKRSEGDIEFEEKAGVHPDDLFQGEEPVAFKFTDIEWQELCKFRTFDLISDNVEASARQVLEVAVGKFVVQELTGANSENVIRLLRALMPKLEQIKPMVSELKKIAGMIDRQEIFNGFGDYQYGSAIDETYFEHFELFNNLMNRCHEEVDRPLVGRKSENAVALVRAIDKMFRTFSSHGPLRRTSKGMGNNDLAFVQTIFEITATRFRIKKTTEGSIESAMKIVMKKSNEMPLMKVGIV